MKTTSILLISLLFCFNLLAQTKNKLCIAFYNQENLFDTIDNPAKIDEEFLPSGTYKWDSQKYFNKLHNMSKVISAMNEGKGPDFLGMCEVENLLVLKDLTIELKLKKQEYGIVWHESPDVRGIDNALIYKLKAVKSVQSHMYIIDSTGLGNDKTRGIVLADFFLKNNSRLFLLVNHWPSRREGEKESEYKRLFVAERLKQIIDSLQMSDPTASIIVMGDFNDYPDNASISNTLQAKREPSEVGPNQLFNPMFHLMEQGLGSYKHQGKWNFLDQLLLSQNLLKPSNKLSYVPESAKTFKQDWMLETEEKYKGNPKRTFGGKKYLNGYSDHLPVYLYLNYK